MPAACARTTLCPHTHAWRYPLGGHTTTARTLVCPGPFIESRRWGSGGSHESPLVEAMVATCYGNNRRQQQYLAAAGGANLNWRSHTEVAAFPRAGVEWVRMCSAVCQRAAGIQCRRQSRQRSRSGFHRGVDPTCSRLLGGKANFHGCHYIITLRRAKRGRNIMAESIHVAVCVCARLSPRCAAGVYRRRFSVCCMSFFKSFWRCHSYCKESIKSCRLRAR